MTTSQAAQPRTPHNRQLRRIAHHLDPVIIIGEQGLSDGVLAETNRALSDHELIKVKVASTDRAERTAVAAQLADKLEAEVVQRIGKIVVLFRANPKANPKLSNLHRAGGGA